MVSKLFALESWELCGVVFAFLALSVEIGHRLGVRLGVAYDERSKEQLGSLQAGILAILGLVLGFAFSASLSRFDERRQLVIDEANAIGTAYLRTQLLPDAERARAAELLRHYMDLRITAVERRRDVWAQPELVFHDLDALQAQLWQLAMEVAQHDARPALNLFIDAMNTMIDLQGARLASTKSRVPRLVTWTVFLFVAVGLGTAVFASSARCGRRLGMWYALASLLTALILLIVDLDRPIYGSMPVDVSALYYERSAMH
jgi:hypothetical protein